MARVTRRLTSVQRNSHQESGVAGETLCARRRTPERRHCGAVTLAHDRHRGPVRRRLCAGDLSVCRTRLGIPAETAYDVSQARQETCGVLCHDVGTRHRRVKCARRDKRPGRHWLHPARNTGVGRGMVSRRSGGGAYAAEFVANRSTRPVQLSMIRAISAVNHASLTRKCVRFSP